MGKISKEYDSFFFYEDAGLHAKQPFFHQSNSNNYGEQTEKWYATTTGVTGIFSPGCLTPAGERGS